MAGKPVPKLTEPELARFWAKVDRADAGCWRWTGAVGKNGYGEFRLGDRVVAAHRISYSELVGPLDSALVLDHRGPDGFGCVKVCVNPRHLEPVPVAENNARQLHRGEVELPPIEEPEQRSLLPA